jgi:hypothetical protein
MDISMTTTVMPTVAAPRLRTERLSALGMPIAQPQWHGAVARTALSGVGLPGATGLIGRVVSDVPAVSDKSTTTTVGGFAGRSVVADNRTNAKQPHPPRGVPR